MVRSPRRTPLHAAVGLAVLIELAVALVSVGPAMADPPTPITVCGAGVTISQSGHYALKADCTGIVGVAITVTANDVHLNLDGHMISGQGPGSGIGIVVIGASRVHISGGTVQSFQSGIELDDASASVVSGVTLTGNFAGVFAHSGSGNSIQSNTQTGGFYGTYLAAESGDSIQGNTVSGNARGIDLDVGTGGTMVSGNITSANSSGIVVERSANGNVVSGNVSDNNVILTIGGLPFGGIGIDVFTNSNVVQSNEANGNASTGIVARFGATGNTFGSNTALGNAKVDLFDDNAPVGGTCPNTWMSDTFDPGSVAGAGKTCIQ
jgi:parallel beta-helix repeat protein